MLMPMLGQMHRVDLEVVQAPWVLHSFSEQLEHLKIPGNWILPFHARAPLGRIPDLRRDDWYLPNPVCAADTKRGVESRFLNPLSMFRHPPNWDLRVVLPQIGEAHL